MLRTVRVADNARHDPRAGESRSDPTGDVGFPESRMNKIRLTRLDESSNRLDSTNPTTTFADQRCSCACVENDRLEPRTVVKIPDLEFDTVGDEVRRKSG